MKKIILGIIALLLMIPFNTYALSTTASSAILMDIDSGRILYSKDIHNARLIASITNIMTT